MEDRHVGHLRAGGDHALAAIRIDRNRLGRECFSADARSPFALELADRRDGQLPVQRVLVRPGALEPVNHNPKPGILDEKDLALMADPGDDATGALGQKLGAEGTFVMMIIDKLPIGPAVNTLCEIELPAGMGAPIRGLRIDVGNAESLVMLEARAVGNSRMLELLPAIHANRGTVVGVIAEVAGREQILSGQ